MPSLIYLIKILSTDITSCITKFIEKQHGCQTTFIKSNESLPFCDLTQMKPGVNLLTTKISNMDEAHVHSLTGCLPPCQYEEFVLKEGAIKEGWACQPNGSKPLELEILVPTGRYEEKEQYVVYDTNSLIADVGGFLGLLLGHSMLSLYHLGTQWITDGKKMEKIKKRLRQGKK